MPLTFSSKRRFLRKLIFNLLPEAEAIIDNNHKDSIRPPLSLSNITITDMLPQLYWLALVVKNVYIFIVPKNLIKQLAIKVNNIPCLKQALGIRLR